MLTYLCVKNLAVVDQLSLEFSEGLNVITGETGAGKSVVLRALSLLCGARASADLVRTGCDRTELEAVFEIPDLEKTATVFSRLGLSPSGDQLILRRVIDAGGRSRCFVNDSVVTQSSLQDLMGSLVEFTGQHDQRILVDENRQLALLDDYADSAGVLDGVLEDVSDKWQQLTAARRRLADVVNRSQERITLLRRLAYEREELEALSPVRGELEGLEAREELLGHVERLQQVCQSVTYVLEDQDCSVEAQLGQVLEELEEASGYDGRFRETGELIKSALLQISEARLGLGYLATTLEEDPKQLEQVRDRIGELHKMRRKYGRDVDELVSYLAEISRELDEAGQGDCDEKQLQIELNRAQSEYLKSASRLSDIRRACSKNLSESVMQGLAEVELKKARFEVAFSSREPSSHGIDLIEFLFSPNPGEEMRSLAKTASGGELSRVLLVLKTVLAQRQPPLLQVFDEVDTGVGGAVAQVVGEKLSQVSLSSQVLVVTHAPQVAALGKRHIRLSKIVENDRTQVRVEHLSPDERISEIARMLGGRKITSHFENSARELLSHQISVEAQAMPGQKVVAVKAHKGRREGKNTTAVS